MVKTAIFILCMHILPQVKLLEREVSIRKGEKNIRDTVGNRSQGENGVQGVFPFVQIYQNVKHKTRR